MPLTIIYLVDIYRFTENNIDPFTPLLTLISINSDFDSTNNIMVKSFPTLFPGGIGDVYDDKRGEVSNSYQWANHLNNITRLSQGDIGQGTLHSP